MVPYGTTFGAKNRILPSYNNKKPAKQATFKKIVELFCKTFFQKSFWVWSAKPLTVLPQQKQPQKGSLIKLLSAAGTILILKPYQPSGSEKLGWCVF